MGDPVTLKELLSQGAVWRGQASQRLAERVLSTGLEPLDRLTGGGWPRAAVTEILTPSPTGIALLAPVLARLSAQERRWLCLVEPPYLPYAPGLAIRGVRLERLLVVEPVASGQALWALEQAMGSGACAVVVGWPQRSSPDVVRRLQLAAERGDCLGVLFLVPDDGRSASPAALRLEVTSVGGRLRVRLRKRRGGWGGQEILLEL